MGIKEKFKEELINHIFSYGYVTRDANGEITMWKENPFHSCGGNYWVGNGESIDFDENFIFSEFEDVKWIDCFLSLNSDNDMIYELELYIDELTLQLSQIIQKIDSVAMISDDVNLYDYSEKLKRDKSYIEKLIDENSEKIKELKKL